MAKVISSPQVFTHPEWTLNNRKKYADAEGDRQSSERLCSESDRVLDETENRRVRTQKDVDKKFEQRLQDVAFWKHELETELEVTENEIDALGAYRKRIGKSIEAVSEPLHIARQCLANRQKRQGIDLVHDDVQKELIKEIEVQEEILALLSKSLEQTDEQLRRNRKARYNLQKDIKDKFTSQSIDEHCSELSNTSENLGFAPHTVGIQAESVTPEDYQDFSDGNIRYAEKQRNASLNLRSILDGILQQTTNDMREQKEKVDLSFKRRIDETRDTKAKLEEHLQKVMSQIQDIQENMAKLEKGILEKETPLKLAHTRLEERSQRPNVELCRDAVQYRLIEEVNELNHSIAKLQNRFVDSQNSLKALTRRKLELEEEIEKKSNSLFIDDVECSGMRQSIHLETF